MHRRFTLTYFLAAACLATTVSCGSRGGVGGVRGTVAVDGQPVEIGTISFQPAATSGAKGAGAAINAGQFQLLPQHGLAAGPYTVAVQASKSTGRTFNDPMRGEVPVMIQLELTDSPKELELSNETAGTLALEFASRKK